MEHTYSRCGTLWYKAGMKQPPDWKPQFKNLDLNLWFGLKSLNLFQPQFFYLYEVDWTKLYLESPPALTFSNSTNVIVTNPLFFVWSSFSIPQLSFNHCFCPSCSGISYHLSPQWNNLLSYSLTNIWSSLIFKPFQTH